MKLAINDLIYLQVSDEYANAKIIKINGHEVTIRPLTNEEKQFKLIKDEQTSNNIRR